MLFVRWWLPLESSALYKIVLRSDFDKTNERACIKLSKLDQDSGFIHAAYGRQVHGIMNKFFRTVNELLVLELDTQIPAKAIKRVIVTKVVTFKELLFAFL